MDVQQTAVTATFLNTEFGLLVVSLVAATLGQFAHFAKKWMKKEIDGNLIDYLFRDHVRETMLTLSSLYGTVLTMYFAGQFHTTVDGQSVLVPMMDIIKNSLMAGFIFDSAFNKGSPKEPVPVPAVVPQQP